MMSLSDQGLWKAGRRSFGTPVKQLLVDCSVVLTPLQPRNLNLSSGSTKRSPAPSYTADKENMAASPHRSSVARKLIVSPITTERSVRDVYVFSPGRSSDSSPRGAVPTRSFYKKDSAYVTPLDRKLISDSKGRGSQDTPTTANLPAGKFTRTKKLPSAGKRKASGNTATLRKTPKSRSTPPLSKSAPPTSRKISPPPKNEGSVSSPEQMEISPKATEDPVALKSAILGLKMKPRPKLTVGAAFFATSKKPHSAPRRPPPHVKYPASSKQTSRPIKENLVPTGKSEATGQEAAGSGTREGARPVPSAGGRSEAQRPVTSAGGRSEAQRPVTSAGGRSEAQRPVEVKVKMGVEDTKVKTGAGPQCLSPASLGAATDSPLMPDADDSIVKSSEKKDSSLYPIFSTPALTKKRPLDFRGDLASPVCSSTPVTAPPALSKIPKPNKRREAARTPDDQLIIDAGQKHFGPVSCGTCGMIYSAASMEDEAQHVQYHQRLLESIRYVGWKKERVVAEFWDGKILMICPDDPKYALRKAEEVRELVDTELGFQQTSLNSPDRTRTYLYVTNDRKIAGCLIAEPIKQGFRVLAEPPSPESKSVSALERHRAWRCSSEAQPAICGISRIWVFALMRRKNIASRLVDTVRTSFIYGSHLTTDEIAFSDPTPDGKLFASSYCGVPDFLVYNFLS
ncbi:N-acetyltransferase ESCO2 isoform X2 [Engystomops pustulosus]|uniref:N-acetyltransferase ESCO2 isoform X2 n=1 Tax=Engystomops pustulosus TaxID=76066 RepID=UPI003AFB80D1